MFQVVNHIEGTVHASPVSRVSTDIRVNTRRRWGVVNNCLDLARLQQSTGKQDLVGLGDIVPCHGIRVTRRCLGHQTNLRHRAGLGNGKVMWHVIRIGEAEFNRFSRLDGNRLLVINHPVRDGTDGNHPDVQVRQAVKDGLGVGFRESAREFTGQLHGLGGLGPGTELGGNLAQVADQVIHHGTNFIGRPVLDGDRTQRVDRGTAISACLDQRRQVHDFFLLETGDPGKCLDCQVMQGISTPNGKPGGRNCLFLDPRPGPLDAQQVSTPIIKIGDHDGVASGGKVDGPCLLHRTVCAIIVNDHATPDIDPRTVIRVGKECVLACPGSLDKTRKPQGKLVGLLPLRNVNYDLRDYATGGRLHLGKRLDRHVVGTGIEIIHLDPVLLQGGAPCLGGQGRWEFPGQGLDVRIQCGSLFLAWNRCNCFKE